jgi:chromosome segregation ATPase
MSPKDTPDDGGSGLLAGLLAPLRLPERALDALEGLVEAAGNLGPMRSELTRVREQTEPLGELLPTLEHLEESLSTQLDSLHKQTEPLGELLPALQHLEERLSTQLDSLHKQTEPLGELLPALEHLEERLGTRLDSVHEVVVELESEDSYLNSTVAALNREVNAMHKTLRGLQDDVQSVTERLPDASRSPLEKAKDVLTGGAAQGAE